MKNAIQQFRISTWPQEGIAIPKYQPSRSPYSLTGDSVIACDVGIGSWVNHIEEEAGIERDALAQVVGPGMPTDPPSGGGRSPHDVIATGEIYLELGDVDLGDSDSIMHFVRRFGPLGISYRNFAVFRSLPWFDSVLRSLAKSWPYTSVTLYKRERGRSPYGDLVETLSEFRFGALCIRDCVKAWAVVGAGADPRSIDWESPPLRALRRERRRRLTYGIELDARGEAFELMLGGVLAGGLTPFHPRVTDPEMGLDFFGPPEARVPLYSLCCLELFNHIAEDATHRTCANETCGRTFVRQAGRAEHEQYRRRGVKYCSVLCARAQAQRMYRARTR